MKKTFLKNSDKTSGIQKNAYFCFLPKYLVPLSPMTKYNIHEKKEKHVRYRNLMRASLVDELYGRILHKIVVEKKYRDPNYSARLMAEELGTNSRYVSAVIGLRCDDNYAGLVNEYRIKEACYMLKERRFAELTMEDIGALVGYKSRQAFYLSFFRKKGETPLSYRRSHMPDK